MIRLITSNIFLYEIADYKCEHYKTKKLIQFNNELIETCGSQDMKNK